MGLGKAANARQHPAARREPDSASPEPGSAVREEPADTAVQPERRDHTPPATPPHVPAQPVRTRNGNNVVRLDRNTAPVNGQPVPTDPPADDAPRSTADRDSTRFPAPTAEEGLADPATLVRRVKVSKRGKRDYNYSWPRADVAVMRQAFDTYRPRYRRYWQEQDPGGAYRLVFSAFLAHALTVALPRVGEWVDTIRNDARKAPIPGGREQVGLVWPVAVEETVVDAWEDFDRSLLPEGFHLTKQHLAAAAILYGLRTVEDWYLLVGNDDRFTVPVQTDGRLRGNRQPRV